MLAVYAPLIKEDTAATLGKAEGALKTLYVLEQHRAEWSWMEVKRLINAPAQKVWEILIDTRLWPVWGPSVKAVECPQRRISAGIRGRLKTAVGLWMEFEITRFEPRRFWGWKVAGLTATGHRLEPRGDSSCELIFELPLAALPYALVCRRAANRIARLAEGASDADS